MAEHKKMAKRPMGNPNIHWEMVRQILSFLPVKSLCRFRCVSKPWSSLISDPDFVTMHSNKTIEDENIFYRRRKLIFTDGENDLLYSLGLDEFLIRNVALLDEDGVENKIDDSGVITELDFKLPNSGDNGVFLVCCCNNLALCKLNSWEELYIVNPATKEYRQLPAAPYSDRFMAFGFGFDDSVEDYKVVNICLSLEDGVEFSLYTLKTDSWRVIQRQHAYRARRIFDGVLLYGGLHWLVERVEEGEEDQSWVIISFLLATEEVVEIPLPFDSFDAEEYNLWLFRDFLCITHSYCGERHNEFWVMEVYGVRESWIKLRISSSLFYDNLSPTCYQKKNHDLLVCDGQLVMYNFSNESFRNLSSIRGLPDVGGEVGIYIDSLVSLK